MQVEEDKYSFVCRERQRKCLKKKNRDSCGSVAGEWLCCSFLAAWICKIGGVPIHLHSYTVICQPDSD